MSSERVSLIGLPTSSVSIRASSSACVSIRSANRMRIFLRSLGEVSAQPGAAARAAATARSTSSAPPSGDLGDHLAGGRVLDGVGPPADGVDIVAADEGSGPERRGVDGIRDRDGHRIGSSRAAARRRRLGRVAGFGRIEVYVRRASTFRLDDREDVPARVDERRAGSGTPQGKSLSTLSPPYLGRSRSPAAGCSRDGQDVGFRHGQAALLPAKSQTSISGG